MSEQNETTDVSALEKAVEALTKAAGSTKLVKGGIENSGTTIDGKPGGGGQVSDFGALDDMMIGKMTAAGMDAGTIAAFGQFLAAKAGEEVDEDEEEEEIAEKSARRPAQLQKSTMDLLREDEALAEQVDVSEYLEHITARVADQIDNVRKSMAADRGNQVVFNGTLAAATVEMARLVKSQSRVMGEMAKRLGIVEAAPVAQPRGAVGTPRAKALQKSMAGGGDGEMQPLRKSELLSTLTYLNLEKGVKSINGQRTAEIVTLYEGGSVLDESTVKFAQGWLAAHPAEAEMAKNYA